jgi:4-hydroxy-L-threonine phosphate dehydrogenase PdxA
MVWSAASLLGRGLPPSGNQKAAGECSHSGGARGGTVARPEALGIRQSDSLGSIEDFYFGKSDVRYGQAAADRIRTATEMCLRGNTDAMVIAPIYKEAVAPRGTPLLGHTEYIAELCGATDSRMLFEDKRLCTVDVSTQVPLQKACRHDTARILRRNELGDEAMKLRWVKTTPHRCLPSQSSRRRA